jgi:hypothetical protein
MDVRVGFPEPWKTRVELTIMLTREIDIEPLANIYVDQGPGSEPQLLSLVVTTNTDLEGFRLMLAKVRWSVVILTT